jgi:hypothetical protein
LPGELPDPSGCPKFGGKSCTALNRRRALSGGSRRWCGIYTGKDRSTKERTSHQGVGFHRQFILIRM